MRCQDAYPRSDAGIPWRACGYEPCQRGADDYEIHRAGRTADRLCRCPCRTPQQSRRSNKNVRVIVHDKSSLAPEGKSLAFNLGNEEGFYWLDGYENISPEELLSGYGNTEETKTMQAEELIRAMLDGGEELPCGEIFAAAKRKQISQRTVNEAKKNIKGIVTRKVGVKWMWSIPGEDCNIAEVSYEKE